MTSPIHLSHLRAMRFRFSIGLLPSYRLVVVFFVPCDMITFVITCYSCYISLRAVHLQIHCQFTMTGMPKRVVDLSTLAWWPCGVSFGHDQVMLSWQQTCGSWCQFGTEGEGTSSAIHIPFTVWQNNRVVGTKLWWRHEVVWLRLCWWIGPMVHTIRVSDGLACEGLWAQLWGAAAV